MVHTWWMGDGANSYGIATTWCLGKAVLGHGKQYHSHAEFDCTPATLCSTPTTLCSTPTTLCTQYHSHADFDCQHGYQDSGQSYS